MKLNHKFALLLAGAVLAGSLTGCGASGTPASSAASSEAAASSAVSEAASEPAAEAALPDGVYTADFDTDSSMFHANEANDGKGTLTVKDGQMTFHVSLVSKKIVNLYVGMAADAEAHEGDWLQPTTDTVTYSDGLSDEVYGFDIPVEALDTDFSVAILGKKGKWYDTVILIVSLLLISVPTFVTGFVMQYVFGIQWAILPVTAGADPGFLDLLMPAMVLGSVSMAYIIRLTRSEISSNIAEDYVRTARAKGMSNGQVMLRHVLRNSLIPVVTYLGQDIGALMGGAMITEQIFNIHGIGFLTYQSILKGEANLVVSIVTLLMLIFVVCNLVVDMLYAALDPRIRYA